MSWEIKMAKAIKILDSNAIFRSEGTSWDDVVIEWLEGTNPISKEDIKTEMDKL
tara:strand:- start:65 stop:226 length:162 start_codon:yes stop_codon:yes gene_type:complete